MDVDEVSQGLSDVIRRPHSRVRSRETDFVRRSVPCADAECGNALPAMVAIFRTACRLWPALATILIPASVLSKKSAILSRSASDLISRPSQHPHQCLTQHSTRITRDTHYVGIPLTELTD